MRIVLCGSYGDMNRFSEILGSLREDYGEQNVFPNAEHLQRSRSCIEAHHEGKGETSETIATRSELMKSYFNHIDLADLVVVMNEKNGEEHYGIGTTIELGYAFAKGKTVRFTREPTNANIQSLATIAKTQP
jgi:nucleoside 2-deoxyribosyltransferase